MTARPLTNERLKKNVCAFLYFYNQAQPHPYSDPLSLCQGISCKLDAANILNK